MTDNVQITAGSGTTIAADNDGSNVYYQAVKITWGPDGTMNRADVASGKAFPVQLRGSDGTDRSNLLPVSLASLPALVAGTAIIGKVGIDQTTPGTTNGVQVTNASIAVTGTFWQATQPVSGTVTANPSDGTPLLKNGLSTTVSSVIASQAARLTSYYIYNPNSSVAYVQIFDVATAGGVTLGTTPPKWSIGIPPTSAANLAGLALAFANGIQVAATTTATGLTAPSTALDCNFGYR